MKIDRDNFRHLTGFGRDMANFVSQVFDKLESTNWPGCDVFKSLSKVSSGGYPIGNIIIHHDRDANTLKYNFAPFKEPPDHILREYDDAVQLTLSIIVHRGDSRECTSIPLAMLSLNWAECYHIYQHRFMDGTGESLKHGCYTGVTKRGWRARWQQHLYSANSGSHYRFHRAIREWGSTAHTVLHTVVGCAPSEQGAMEIEEFFVERDSLYPKGLNMIPGGKSGLAYLRKIGAIGQNERVSVDDRQDVINRFFDRTSRKGLPNPLAAANWLSPDYAEKVICAGPDRLKPQQIRDARFFASLGGDADDIATRIGARNTAQVERLLSGETYSRIL